MFSHCGSFVVLIRLLEPKDSRCSVWSLPEHMQAGHHHASTGLPQTMQPGQLLYSQYWGGTTMYFESCCAQGHLEISFGDSKYSGITMLCMQVPTYLAGLTPVVILGGDGTQPIKLVFLCPDRQPEVMILFDTWASLVARFSSYLRQRLSLDCMNSRFDTIAGMLELNAEAT